MRKKEASAPKVEKKEKPSTRSVQRTAPFEEKSYSVGALQEFLTQIKLFALLKKENPGTVSFEKLKGLEEKLSSKNNDERSVAKKEIDELSDKFSTAKADANKPLNEVVRTVLDQNISRPAAVQVLIEDITQQNSVITEKLANKKRISKGELEAFGENLNQLKAELGLRVETRDGLVQMDEMLNRAVELRKVRMYMEAPSAIESPINGKKDFFEEGQVLDGENKNKLVIRQANKKDRVRLEKTLESFKDHVRRELIEDNGDRLGELEGEDLLSRLEEVSDLKARMRNLVGKEHGRIEETLEVLSGVEVQYQVALEQRMVGDLKESGVEVNDLAVGEAVRGILSEARGGRRTIGRARYEIQDSYKEMASKVYKESRKLVNQGYAAPSNGMELPPEDQQAMLQEMMSGRQREKSVKEKVQEIDSLLKRAQLDGQELLERMHEMQTLDERLDYAKSIERAAFPNLGESERRVLSQFLEASAGSEAFLNIQARLKESVSNGRFGEYMVELKAYIARIGLQETSADYQLAFLLRDAKEVITRFEPDIGDEFDSWRSSLFIPPIKSVSPEAYRQVFEKVWGAGNLDHVFNPSFANAEAMSVTINGQRKNISTAVFYQLLQQTENSNRLLNAPVNSTDSTMFGELVVYLYGKGTTIEGLGNMSTAIIKAADGSILFDAGRGDKFNIQYFDLVNKSLQAGTEKSISLATMLDQVTWMERYAINFWSYSGEAGNHYRHYPKEDMENANKWLFAQNQMFEGYGGHFGKYDPPFWEIAKLSHMLREIRSYKDSSLIKGATVDTLEKGGMSGSRAAKFAEVFTGKLTKKMKIDEKTFKVGLLTLEEARLIGNTYSNAGEAWGAAGYDWLIAHGTPAEMVKNADEIRVILDKRSRRQKLSEQEKNWAVQADEFFALCKDLKWTGKEKEFIDTLTGSDLKPLADRVNTIFGIEWEPQNMKEFIKGFEYASVMDLGKYAQGSDPIEYAQKYMKLSEEVAKKLPKIQKGVATSKDIIELQEAMRAYLTPEEVDDFFEILTRKTILTHTFQVNKYEIAKLNADQRTINYKQLKDENGHTYYFVGRDGHRIANTEWYRGAYFNWKQGTKTWRQSDVEILLDAMKSQAMLPRGIAESMLDDLVGGGRSVDKFLKNFGIDTKTSKGAKIAKAVLARTKRFVGRLPLFDDPGWAAWSFGAELLNFMMEAGKEVVKGTIK